MRSRRFELARKPKSYDRDRSVRRIARQRVGAVPAAHPMEPKTKRKRPKHKKQLMSEDI